MNILSAITLIISSFYIKGSVSPYPSCQISPESGLSLTNDTYQASDIAFACCRRGLFPVEITNSNFLAAVDLAFSCVGERSMSWIGYWYDSIYDANLVLTTGNQNGGGAINVPSGSPSLNVMCQDLPTAQYGPAVCDITSTSSTATSTATSSSSSVASTSTITSTSTAFSSSTPLPSSTDISSTSNL